MHQAHLPRMRSTLSEIQHDRGICPVSGRVYWISWRCFCSQESELMVLIVHEYGKVLVLSDNKKRRTVLNIPLLLNFSQLKSASGFFNKSVITRLAHVIPIFKGSALASILGTVEKVEQAISLVLSVGAVSHTGSPSLQPQLPHNSKFGSLRVPLSLMIGPSNKIIYVLKLRA